MNVNNVVKTEYKSKGFSQLLVISLIAASFKNIIPGLDLGDILLLVGMLWLLVSHPSGKHAYRIETAGGWLMILYLLFVAMTLVNGEIMTYFSVYDSAIRIIRWGFYILVIWIGADYIMTEYLIQLLKKLSILASILLYIQKFSLIFTGKAITATILGRTIGNSVEYLYVSGVWAKINRPSAFFSEPAHFTCFAALGLLFYMLDYKNPALKRSKAIFATVFLTGALLLSTSTYAFFMLLLLWGWFIVFQIRLSPKVLVSLLVVLLILLAMSPLLLQHMGIGWDYLLTKIAGIGSTSRTTYFTRYASMLPGIHQYIGVGVGNEEYYLLNAYHYELGYVNSINMTYLYCGIVGIILLALYWLSFFCSIRSKYWIIGLMSIFICLCSTDFYGKFSVLYLVIAQTLSDHDTGGKELSDENKANKNMEKLFI